MPTSEANYGGALGMSNKSFPTLDHVWMFAALALVALRPLLTPIPPHDFWWHMATGRLIVQTGAVPLVDSFSYTQAGEPFYNQGWLAQVFMYAIYSLGGLPLIIIAQVGVLVLSYGLLLRLCIRRSGQIRLSVGLLLLAVLVSFDNWHVRPQTYALPLFVAFLFLLTGWREGGLSGRWLGLLPLLMAVWVNLHGSFVLGGVLIALTFVGVGVQRLGGKQEAPLQAASDTEAVSTTASARPPLRMLLIWGALTAVAILLNPRGVGVIGYVIDLLGTSAVTDLVEEWAPPTTRTFTGSMFFGFVLIGVTILAYARRRPDLVDMLLAGALFWLALGAERNIIWFATAITPLLVVQSSVWRTSSAKPVPRRVFQGVPALNATLIGLLGLLILLALPWIKPHLGLPPDIGGLMTASTPERAVEALRTDVQRPERLFHAMSYGSYLIWAAPEQPVFIDTRIELYPLQQWRDYLMLTAGNDVERLVERYDIDGLLLDKEEQARLWEDVQAAPEWQVRYTDEESAYLVRVR